MSENMRQTVLDDQGEELGYYYWDNLSKGYMAVKADGARGTARSMNAAERWIKGE